MFALSDAAPLSSRYTLLDAARAERARRPAPPSARRPPVEPPGVAVRLPRGVHVDPMAMTLDGAATEASPPPSGQDPGPVSSRRAAAYAPGAVLCGRYQLLEPLGEGGMGAVWRARCLVLDVDVAVKLVRRSAGVPNAGERLLREARVAARVRHPAAVRVLDFCHTGTGDPFLVMELLAGRTLARALADDGPLPPVRAAQLLLPVIAALSAAHREGIVHRDVKPANVMLVDADGRVVPKLIDFGIAGVAPSAWSSKLASYGMLVGSPAYMAPEQARGATDVDGRTDVWAICAVLYEAVSGERPFGRDGRTDLVREILSTRPRRPEALAAYPGLWMILERGLAKSPEDRWPTMDALGAALSAWAFARGATSDATGAALSDR